MNPSQLHPVVHPLGRVSQSPLPALWPAQATSPAGQAKTQTKSLATPSLTHNAPGILVPLRFVCAGVLALLTGSGLLAWHPELLATYHYNQYIIAVTHLFVLGWLTTIVMGAMYQLVPVALETRLYSERLARWHFLLHLIGFTGMVWSFWTWNMKHVGHYGSILAIGVALFIYNLARTLLRVPRWTLVATAVASASTWLGLTILAGLTLAAGKCSYESAEAVAPATALGGFLHVLRASALFVGRFDQISAMHAHAHLGGVGVFLVLLVGISYKLVPMFTLSEVQSRLRARWSLLLLNASLAGLFVAILLRSPLKFLCALGASAALVLYGWEMRAIIRARKRRALDWGLKYFVTALCLLLPVGLIALVLSWPGLPLTRFTGQLENVYGFLGLLGVISLAVIGMLYKVVPFLVWYRSYSSEIGRSKVPSLAELYSTRLQKIGYWNYLLALVTTTVGSLLSNAVCVRMGCVLLALSLAMLMANMALILSHLVRLRCNPLPPLMSAAPNPLTTYSKREVS